MTRNQFIAQSYMRLCIEHNYTRVDALGLAKGMADVLESEGCAPWQDAPAQTGEGGIKIVPMSEPVRREITEADILNGGKFTLADGEEVIFEPVREGRFDVFNESGKYQTDTEGLLASLNHDNATAISPQRREITEADVQVGARFTDEDGETFVPFIVDAHRLAFTCTNSRKYGDATIEAFINARNRYNATVIPSQP